MTQRKIPAVYMRGGTSRCLVFHERDLPPAGWRAFCVRGAVGCVAHAGRVGRAELHGDHDRAERADDAYPRPQHLAGKADGACA